MTGAKNARKRHPLGMYPQFNLSRFILAKATGEKLEHSEQMCVSAAREDFGKTKDGGVYLPNQMFQPTTETRSTRPSLPIHRAQVGIQWRMKFCQ